MASVSLSTVLQYLSNSSRVHDNRLWSLDSRDQHEKTRCLNFYLPQSIINELYWRKTTKMFCNYVKHCKNANDAMYSEF